MTSARQAVWAIFGVFFCESIVLGSWIPRIPDIKIRLLLDDFTLGLCLLAIPAGTIVAFLIAGRLLDWLGLRRCCQIFLPCWALVFMLPGLVTAVSMLFVVLFFAGFAMGLCEVAMNSKADTIERDYDRRIMSRCHGFWSLGSMVGALIGSAFAETGWSVVHHYLAVMPLIAVLSWFVATALPGDRDSDDTRSSSAAVFRLPSAAIVMLCLMPVGIMMIEGAFIDWSALFMRDVLTATPLVAGLTYVFFSFVMTVIRLSGDTLAAKFGEARIVRWSTLSAVAGITVFALAPTVAVALIGATLSGIGVAIVYPLAISAAARRPGNLTDNVAAMSLLAFVAFLIAPPVIGFVSDSFGLRVALLMLLPVALLSVFLSPEVERKETGRQR